MPSDSSSRPIGIAMVAATTFPANHGSPASIREMSQELARMGHRVHIITYHLKDDIPVEGVTIHRTPDFGFSKDIMVGPTKERPLYDLFLSKLLCRVIREQKLEVIHAHNYEGALAGFVGKLFTGKPLLFNSVTNMKDELPTYGFIKPRWLAGPLGSGLDYFVPRLADRLTTVTEELRDFYTSSGVEPWRIKVIPPGVDLGMFEESDPEKIRRRCRLDSRPVFIYTGVLNEFQGIEDLIEASRLIFREKPEAVLILMGNVVTEEQSSTYLKMIAEKGLEKNVVFHKNRPLSELPDYLAAADVAIIPRSLSPGYPVKLLNYMASSKAIVSFKGSAKGLESGKNAIVVRDRDIGEFARAVVKLLNDPDERRKMGKEARKTVENEYGWRSLALQILEIYNGMLEQNNPRVGLFQ